MTAYEIDYCRKIFDLVCSPSDLKISFSGFLRVYRQMSHRLVQQPGFMHRAAYHFRLADSDCDGRITFEEFLFAYVGSREAALISSRHSSNALDSGCSMGERPPPPPFIYAPPRRRRQERRYYSISPSPSPTRQRRRRAYSRYRCLPVTDFKPDYLSDLDRRAMPIKDLANRVNNNIYDI